MLYAEEHPLEIARFSALSFLSTVSSSSRNCFPAPGIRLRINCEAISGPGLQGQSHEVVVASQKPERLRELEGERQAYPTGSNHRGREISGENSSEMEAFHQHKEF